MRIELKILMQFLFLLFFVNGCTAADDSEGQVKKASSEVRNYSMAREEFAFRSIKEYEEFYSAVYIGGVIDDTFVSKVVNLDPNVKNIIVYSPGGISQEAIKAAEHIKAKALNVIVLTICSSACSEFLLPAANKITFIEEPLVGFHGNTIAAMNFVKEETGNEADYCSVRHAMEAKIFYLKTLKYYDFWKEQYSRLNIQSVDINDQILDERTSCKTVSIQTQHEMWFPTSRQLRKLYKLNFEGELCADDASCYSRRLKFYPSGTSVIIGNEAYIVSNP